MRILLIEDEAPLARMVTMGLEKARYQVDWVPDGAAGFQKLLDERYDLILLDLMLPGMDGWTLCRRLRDRRDPTPILMLTARDEVEDRVRGLELGADDYLPKPFDFRELHARVAALLRRGGIQRRRLLAVADLEIDTEARQVKRAGKELWLTPREFDLLVLLARNEGQTVSRERIQQQVWGEAETSSNAVEVHLAALRKKIDAGRSESLIQTVHRQGYALRIPEAP